MRVLFARGVLGVGLSVAACNDERSGDGGAKVDGSGVPLASPEITVRYLDASGGVPRPAPMSEASVESGTGGFDGASTAHGDSALDAAESDSSTASVRDARSERSGDHGSPPTPVGHDGGDAADEWLAPGISLPRLTRRTDAAGLTMLHMPDPTAFGAQAYMSGGAAIGDFDRDGFADVFVPSAGLSAARLFINQGDGTFVDRASSWGLTTLEAGNGATVGDFDGDGWLDVFVTSFGSPGELATAGAHRLYRNTGSAFVDVAASAGVATVFANGGGYGAAFGDYDLDGDLDLFVAMWTSASGAQFLFQNQGDGTFVDVTNAAVAPGVLDGVWAFQPAFVDTDGDRYPELLLTGDFGTSRYLVNDGDGTFSDRTVEAGVGLDQNGMGQTIFDVDRDARLDWHVSGIFIDGYPADQNRRSMLYRATGLHLFEEISIPVGLADQGWGWGVVAVDVDQDGFDDVLEVNGREAMGGEWAAEHAKLFHAERDGTFSEIGGQSGFDHAESGRALITLDAEHDGDMDVVVITNTGALAYYANTTPQPGHWLQVVLDTSARPDLAPDGMGARVEVDVGGVTLVRVMNGAPSYLGTSELVAHFGLGLHSSVEGVRVRWADGTVTDVAVSTVDRRLVVSAQSDGG